MFNLLKSYYRQFAEKLHRWAVPHYFQLAVLNMILIILLLLRSAGYFEPFFSITINAIFFAVLGLSALFLGINSTAVFAVALIFWLFAAVLRLAGINVWAERTSIYVFQALLVGVVLLVIDCVRKEKGRSDVK